MKELWFIEIFIAGRLFDTTTKVFQERKMDTKNYPWYLVNRKEEHVVENVSGI